MTRYTVLLVVLIFFSFEKIFSQTKEEQLLTAAETSYERGVFDLLKEGANPNAVNDYGVSALMFAADNGNLYIVKTLLSFKADVSLAPYDGTTALLAAAKKNHVEVVQLLLAAGASPNIKDNQDYTPLYYAVDFGFPLMADVLCKAGANPETPCDNYTPLMLAALHSDVEIMDVLLQNSANVNATDIWKITPLMIAAQKDLTSVEFLVKNGAAVEAQNADYLIALDIAAANGKLDIVEFLLANGARPHTINGKTTTRLLAEGNGHADIARRLSQPDVKQPFKPVFACGNFGFSEHFNHTDYMLGLQGGFSELLWNLDFTVGYHIRPYRKKVLIQESEHFYTQYRASGNEFFCSAQKKFAFKKTSGKEFGMFVGGKGAMYFGGYRGADENYFMLKPVPEIGIYKQNSVGRLKFSYEYVTFEPTNLSAHILVFSYVFTANYELPATLRTSNY